MTDRAAAVPFFSRANLPAIGAGLAFGAGLGLVSPPVGLAELGWGMIAPLLVVLAGARTPWERFRTGWFAGTVGVLALFYWVARTLVHFGGLPWVAGLALLALYCLAFGLPYAVLGLAVAPLRRALGPWWGLALATVWVAVEWLQPAIFPYFQGSFQFRRAWIWQLASVFGPFGVSWLLVAVNAALAELWLRRREGARAPVAPLAVVAALGLGAVSFGAWRHAKVGAVLASAPAARVGFWQARRFMTRPAARGVETMPPLLEITRTLAASKPDLIVWPEGAIYPTPDQEPQRTLLADVAREGGVPLIIGATTTVVDAAAPGGKREWNSAWMFGADGEVVGHYDKMVLLAFGEQLPAVIEPLRPYLGGAGGMTPGTEVVTFTTGTFRFTVPICYEILLESQVRRMADADVLVNITNDAWFGHTSEPHQHLMLAAAAAMQFGRPVVRVAVTGTSAVVEPDGTLVGETPTFTEQSGILDVRVAAVPTVWRTWGQYFPHACTAAGALLLALAGRRSTAA